MQKRASTRRWVGVKNGVGGEKTGAFIVVVVVVVVVIVAGLARQRGRGGGRSCCIIIKDRIYIHISDGSIYHETFIMMFTCRRVYHNRRWSPPLVNINRGHIDSSTRRSSMTFVYPVTSRKIISVYIIYYI